MKASLGRRSFRQLLTSSQRKCDISPSFFRRFIHFARDIIGFSLGALACVRFSISRISSKEFFEFDRDVYTSRRHARKLTVIISERCVRARLRIRPRANNASPFQIAKYSASNFNCERPAYIIPPLYIPNVYVFISLLANLSARERKKLPKLYINPPMVLRRCVHLPLDFRMARLQGGKKQQWTSGVINHTSIAASIRCVR